MILEEAETSYAGAKDLLGGSSYQSEEELEKGLLGILRSQAYQYLDSIKSEEDMQDNLRAQMEKLNRKKLPEGRFTDDEWQRFFHNVIANRSEGLLEKSRKLRTSHSFLLDSGKEVNLRLKSNDPSENTFQVVNQIERKAGKRDNRYDVTILVNGLPAVHIELKRRGVRLREAFNQVNRYRRDSFWSESGLFLYVQIFVISNGTLTRYYSNTVKELSRKNQEGHTVTQKKTFAYQFTSAWADRENQEINDLGLFARTFLEHRRLTTMLYKYSVIGTDDIMRTLRPYQVYAVEAIERQVILSEKDPRGGYIWHTTGSGKTLTSFVAASHLSKRDDIDKVIFAVDRKDLDYQTMIEFNRFHPGSVDGTNSTKELERQLHSKDDKIVVTTIQKLDRYTRNNKKSPFKNSRVVLIFDECHRSQFGVFQENISRFFRNAHLFGFTGTPIFAENAKGGSKGLIAKGNVAQLATTEAVFGDLLHRYTIVEAIHNQNVLPFKVDYVNTIKKKGRKSKKETSEEVPGIDKQEVLHSPERIRETVSYILDNHDKKTRKRSFNAILATASVEVAQKYYQEFKKQQAERMNQESSHYDPDFKALRVATIYSYAPNDDDGSSDGDINSIDDEVLENTSGLSESARDRLDEAIDDYNEMFSTNFDAGSGFPNYYKDISKNMKSHKDSDDNNVSFAIDILIVVNMFLTGFDAPRLNTLYVDKNLRLHGLLQAFSRTNRILNSEKSHGEIVCFRNLRDRVDESISLFGDKEATGIVLLRPYKEYLKEYEKALQELERIGPTEELLSEKDKKEFIQIWSEVLRLENILQTFDQHTTSGVGLTAREMQDYTSYYLELKDLFTDDITGESILDDVVFETELVRSIEVNIDYILKLIEAYHTEDKNPRYHDLVIRGIESSPTLRNKKELLEDFISKINSPKDIEIQFKRFVSDEAEKELVDLGQRNDLDLEKTRQFLNRSLKDKAVLTDGTALVDLNSGASVGFGKKRNAWKEKIAKELIAYFDKYVDFVGEV
jgi:type I restriction enzyme R subunit